MWTKSSKLPEAAASSKGGEEDDIGALIYRESQLRKKEAAVAAVKKKNEKAAKANSSSRSRSCAADGCTDTNSGKTLIANKSLKKRTRHISGNGNEEQAPTITTAKVARKNRIGKECSADGCNNYLEEEECAWDMGQRSNYVAVRDAPT